MRLFLVVAVAAATLFGGLGSVALFDRDEPEYVLAALEMQRSGAWLIPTFEGKAFLEKPPLVYWWLRASFRAFGASEVSARLPSAALGVATCLVTYGLAATHWGSETGLYAAIVLATSPLFVGASHLVLTDPSLVFFTTLSFFFYVLGESFARRWLVLAYAAAGFAILAKGPVGLFAPLVFVIHEWLGSRDPLGQFVMRTLRRHFLPAAVALAIASPWFVYSFLAEPRATAAFFSSENLARFRRGFEGHTGSLLYYLPVLFGGFLPWSLFFLPLAWCSWRAKGRPGPMEPAIRLFSAAVLVVFVVFSLAATKLPHYMLPAFPPLACLTARLWTSPPRSPSAERGNALVMVALGGLLALGPLALYAVRPQYAALRLTAPGLAFLALAVAALRAARRADRRWTFAATAAASAAFLLGVSTIVLPWLDRFRVVKPIALELRRSAPPGARVYAYAFREPSLFFYSGRTFPVVAGLPLEKVLCGEPPAYVVVKESTLARQAEDAPFVVVARQTGFAENGGEMTLLLVRADPARCPERSTNSEAASSGSPRASRTRAK